MNANETAVIFIEFQNDFCAQGGKLHEGVKKELARVGTIDHARKLLDGARQKGCKIIHSPFTLDKKWIAERGATGLLSQLAEGEIFMPGSWGQEIISELAPREGEIVLEGKRALSAFSHTNLADILRFAGIKNVIICGFLTNLCVQATAWSAYDLGFRTRIVAEACAATDAPIQNYVESQIVPIFAGPEGAITVDEFLASLN